MQNLWRGFLLCFLIAVNGPVFAVDVVTAAVVSDELMSIVRQAEASGESLVGEAGKQAQAALERLERIVGDKMTMPIQSLDAGLRAEVSAARGVASALRATLDALPKCVGNEAQLLLAGVKSGINTSLSGIPLVKGVPLAYLVEDISRGVPYVLKHDESMGERHLVVRGSNLWAADEVCSVTAVAEGVTTDSKFELAVLGHDLEKFDLRMPASIRPGQYYLRIGVAEKGWFSCGKPKYVSAGFSVVPPQSVKLSVSSMPTCQAFERHATSASLQESNNGCNTDNERSTRLIQFDRPGFSLERFEFRNESNSRGSASAERSGDGVLLRVSAQGRGNTCSHGTGRGRGSVTLFGKKRIPSVLGAEQVVLEQVVLSQDQSVPFSLPAVPAECQAEAFTISADGVFAGGKSVALPPMTVSLNGQQTSYESGMKAFFNGVTRSGTVALSGSCL